MTTTHSDEELIFMLQNNLEQLYNIFYQKYFRLIKLLVSEINLASTSVDKADLYQIGYIALYKALASYRESDGKFITYLRHCVRNAVFHLLKKNILICSEEEVDNFESDFFTPENYSDFYDSYTSIQKIINNLNNLESSVWYLYHQGYSYQEISNKLRVNTKRIDNIIQKIKNKISDI